MWSHDSQGKRECQERGSGQHWDVAPKSSEITEKCSVDRTIGRSLFSESYFFVMGVKSQIGVKETCGERD